VHRVREGSFNSREGLSLPFRDQIKNGAMTEPDQANAAHKNDKVIISKIVVIVAVFVLISVLFSAQIYFYGALHEGVRSFVRGEGIWAKAQKEATVHLTQYVYTHDDDDYEAFRKNIEVTLGDRKARLALSQSPPDIAAAREGLLRGGNDAEDIDTMIAIFLNFGGLRHIKEAIETWTIGDEKIAQLIGTAEALEREIKAPHPSKATIHLLHQKIIGINAELHILEDRFSAVLSEGARWVRSISWNISLVILALLISTGILASRQIIRSISRELAARKSLEDQIFNEAREDPLTGLYNRKFFSEQFERYLKLAGRENRHCALLYLDLDNFKPINDTHGHSIGDAVLKAAAEIFQNQFRSTDLIARIGGDEFIVLLVHPCDRDGVEISAERVIEELEKPMIVDGTRVKTGVSIGAAVYPEDGDDMQTLVNRADKALYVAKESGRGRIVFFEESFLSNPER